MAAGCIYGARCQYSHDTTWLRRNPLKYSYASTRCPDQAQATASTALGCSRGIDCDFAHSAEEERFHPVMYKTSLCPDGGTCSVFYCPFFHGSSDQRSRGGGLASSRRRTRAPTGGRCPVSTSVCEQVTVASLSAADESALPSVPNRISLLSSAGEANAECVTSIRWWQFGPLLRVAVTPDGEGLGGRAENEDPSLAGAALVDGRFSPGRLRLRGADAEMDCIVKLVLTDRRLHIEAKRVVKETRRWKTLGGRSGAGGNHGYGGRVANAMLAGAAASDGTEGSGDVGASNRVVHTRMYELKRTVAAIALAMPQHPSTLDRSAPLAFGDGGVVERVARGDLAAALFAARCVWQLVAEVRQLHASSLTHTCITPRSVIVTAGGHLRLGDFLGKIRTVNCLMHGSEHSTLDDAWAMWYPAEVQKRLRDSLSRCSADPSTSDVFVAEGDAGDSIARVDCFKLDAWQLGVVTFILLTLQHPFGDCRDPSSVCRNIIGDNPVNMELLDALPLFKDLVGRLLMHSADERANPEDAMNHPVFWTIEDALAASRISDPALPLLTWRHVPAMAVPVFMGLHNHCTDTIPAHDDAGDVAALLLLARHVNMSLTCDTLSQEQKPPMQLHIDAPADERFVSSETASCGSSVKKPDCVRESPATTNLAQRRRNVVARPSSGKVKPVTSVGLTEEAPAAASSAGSGRIETRRKNAQEQIRSEEANALVPPPPGLESPSVPRTASARGGIEVDDPRSGCCVWKQPAAQTSSAVTATVATTAAVGPMASAAADIAVTRSACQLMFDDLGEGVSVCYVGIVSSTGDIDICTGVSHAQRVGLAESNLGSGVRISRSHPAF
eukprot:TRINITY_DN50603_c0_g1_i1.p1 TRINITY_DN50603_c0_g1~~TRINITY_DN50603_c0_g1_i1.p1  ORF type:complete len:888 (-),score=121.86 TRINITY_DN50603_c0_g1_i1:442-2964(-)